MKTAIWAETINSFHSGRATYVEFPGMGRGLDRWPSQREWLQSVRTQQHADFDTEFLDQVEKWIRHNLAGASSSPAQR